MSASHSFSSSSFSSDSYESFSDEESSYVEEKKTNPLLKFGKKLRSLDGADELAQALGQILPGIAGPIATASVLAVATPFVFMGLLGMKEEYLEARKEYDEILARKMDTKEKLRLLSAKSEEWRQILSQKLNLGKADKKQTGKRNLSGFDLKGQQLDEFAYHMVESEVLRNEEFVARIGRKYGWTGIVGMGGMFVGMLPAIGSATIGILKEAGVTTEALVSAADVLTTISGSAFLVGQVAMSAYAANKTRQGVAIKKLLKSHKEVLNKFGANEIAPETKKALNEILDRSLHLNKRANIQYGGATVVGQGFMAAGTIASLSGAGSAVGIPLVAIGAPITVGAALGRIVYNAKEEKFKGEEFDYSRKRKEQTSLLQMILADKDTVISNLERDFKYSSRQLAYLKLYSLMNHLTNDRKYKNYSPEQKLQRLEKIVQSGKISWKRRTSLRGDVMEMVSEIFTSNRDEINDFFARPKNAANHSLRRNVVNCMQDKSGKVPDFANHIASDGDSLKDLMKLMGLEGSELYHKIAIQNASEEDYKKLNKVLIGNSKNALKDVRHDLADKMIQMLHIKELQEIIAKEKNVGSDNKFQSMVKRSGHGRSSLYSSSNIATNNRPLNFSEKINSLTESLNIHDSHIVVDKVENARKNQQEIDKIREHAAKEKLDFVLMKTYKNENGDTVYLWEDRKFPGQHLERGVTYIEDKITKKISVQYGTKTSATVIFDGDVNKGISPLMLGIKDANHKVHGDKRNPKLSFDLTGLHKSESRHIERAYTQLFANNARSTQIIYR